MLSCSLFVFVVFCHLSKEFQMYEIIHGHRQKKSQKEKYIHINRWRGINRNECIFFTTYTWKENEFRRCFDVFLPVFSFQMMQAGRSNALTGRIFTISKRGSISNKSISIIFDIEVEGSIVNIVQIEANSISDDIV